MNVMAAYRVTEGLNPSQLDSQMYRSQMKPQLRNREREKERGSVCVIKIDLEILGPLLFQGKIDVYSILQMLSNIVPAGRIKDLHCCYKVKVDQLFITAFGCLTFENVSNSPLMTQ